MRCIVYGAGAIGATLGARLHQSGHDVVLIARGAQAAALRDRGLTFESHDGTQQLRIPVVERPNQLSFRKDDIVLLAMKTQHTAAALADLAEFAPPDIVIACAQNGVENERLALRAFERVLAISVMCPALYLEPGHVQAFGSPLTGILDLGCYPRGSDETCQQLSAAFQASHFDSSSRAAVPPPAPSRPSSSCRCSRYEPPHGGRVDDEEEVEQEAREAGKIYRQKNASKTPNYKN